MYAHERTQTFNIEMFVYVHEYNVHKHIQRVAYRNVCTCFTDWLRPNSIDPFVHELVQKFVCKHVCL